MRGNIHKISSIIPRIKPTIPKTFESSLAMPIPPKTIATIGNAISQSPPIMGIQAKANPHIPQIRLIMPNIFPNFYTHTNDFNYVK